jgi:crotonobetainyl-CoA:carnitine CoA-transferase CaiB-like acyl-CoA transferase
VLDLLNGFTVLDLTSNVSGPFCTMVLADMGATVWKIEPPSGDVVRNWPPFGSDGMSTTFAALNRGKRSIILDLKAPDDQVRFSELAKRADVLVTSMRPGALQALGIEPSELQRSNPALVIADITAFGGRGERGGNPGFDAVLQAYTGLMDLTGYPQQPPARIGTAILDIGTAMWSALGIVSALLARERGYPAPTTSATLFGTAVGFLVHHLASVELADVEPHRIGTAQHNSAPYEAICARDGMVMLGVTSDPMFRRLATTLGLPGLATDERFITNAARVHNRSLLCTAIESVTSTMSCDEVLELFESAGVPCSKVRSVAELADDPQLEAAGLWHHSAHGGRLAVAPVTMDGQTPALARPAPVLGADTDTVLGLISTSALQERTTNPS